MSIPEDAAEEQSPTISRPAAVELATAARDAIQWVARRASQKTSESAAPDEARGEAQQEACVEARNETSGSFRQSLGRVLPSALATDARGNIEQSLVDALAATACDAASVYLLDDPVVNLRLVASAGMDKELRDEISSRRVDQSLAEIEVLAGNMVTVDPALASCGWWMPSIYPMGVCVGIAIDGVPIGTLWFWRKANEPFTPAEYAAMRLTAALLSSMFATDAAVQRREKAIAAIKPLKAAAQWQRQQLSSPTRLAEGWDCGGWVQSPRALASSWFLWDVLPDGMLALVMAEAHGQELDGAMIAATARSAWQSHAGYRHDPAQLLRRINDTLWQTSSSAQPVSMLYAQINPDTGEGALANVGSLSGLIVSRYGYRPLSEACQGLGMQLDIPVRLHQVRLMGGETLVASTTAMLDGSNCMSQADSFNQRRLAERFRSFSGESLQAFLDELKGELPSMKQVKSDRTVLAIRRR